MHINYDKDKKSIAIAREQIARGEVISNEDVRAEINALLKE
jgi:uncharacterized membrane protein